MIVADRRYAYRILRAFLHTVRDRLTVDEAAQLAAQAKQSRRFAFEESPDIKGQGGR